MAVSVKIQNPIYILYHQSANMSESTVSVSDIDGWIFYRFHDRILLARSVTSTDESVLFNALLSSCRRSCFNNVTLIKVKEIV